MWQVFSDAVNAFVQCLTKSDQFQLIEKQAGPRAHLLPSLSNGNMDARAGAGSVVGAVNQGARR